MTAKPRYFVIFGAMRTGSNLLERTLGTLPDVAVHGELFNGGFIGGPGTEEYLGWSLADRDSDPVGFLQTVIASEPHRLPGMRMFNGHNDRAVCHALADPTCARIILTRSAVESWVSLQIARETNQWILRNPGRRVSARISFDAAAFTSYRNELVHYYSWIEEEMRQAGTGAFRIDYRELENPDAVARAARHIGSAHRPVEAAPIHRQNPEPMSEKVVNFQEMVDFLGHEEPAWRAVPPPLVSPAEVLIARGAPLAHAMMPGGGSGAALGLMQRIDRQRFGIPAEPREYRPQSGSKRNAFQRVRTAKELEFALAGRSVFTIVRHPFARLHAGFLADLFGEGWGSNPIRRALQDRVGPLPSLSMIEDDRTSELSRADFTQARHQSTFNAYLDLAQATQTGRSNLPMRPIWQTQRALVDAWMDLIGWVDVIRFEDFSGFAERLSFLLRIDPLPPGQIYNLQTKDQISGLPALRAMSPGTEERVRALFTEDFEAFGYDALTAQMEDPRAA